jgi:hypothetical protein
VQGLRAVERELLESAEAGEVLDPSTHSRLSRSGALLTEAAVPAAPTSPVPRGPAAWSASSAPPADPVVLARAVLTDHDGRPLSICRHPSHHEPTVTGVTVLLDTATRRATFTFGNPCQTPPSDTVEVDLTPT